MTGDYQITLATPADIPGILTLQESNLVERGGSLSVQDCGLVQKCDSRKVGCRWPA
jgi:hypothetical protein